MFPVRNDDRCDAYDTAADNMNKVFITLPLDKITLKWLANVLSKAPKVCTDINNQPKRCGHTGQFISVLVEVFTVASGVYDEWSKFVGAVGIGT